MKEVKQSQEYIEGFNKGYIIREHKPELALSLSQIKFPNTELDYKNGLRDGIKQRHIEFIKKNENTFTKNNDLDLER